MTKILYGYFTYFLHPLQVNNYFRKTREDLRALSTPYLLDDEISLKLEEDDLKLDFSDVLSVSWIFVLINCLYSLALLHLGAALLKLVDSSSSYGNPKSLIFFTVKCPIISDLLLYFLIL